MNSPLDIIFKFRYFEIYCVGNVEALEAFLPTKEIPRHFLLEAKANRNLLSILQLQHLRKPTYFEEIAILNEMLFEDTNNEDDFNGLDYTLKPIVTLQETTVDSGDQSDEIVFEE